MSSVYKFDLISKRMSTSDSAIPSARHSDLQDDTLYVVDGTSIKAFSAGDFSTGIWKSKLFRFPYEVSLGWFQVTGPFNASVTVKIYADSTLVHTKTVLAKLPYRIPVANARTWEVQIESTGRVTSVCLSQSGDDL